MRKYVPWYIIIIAKIILARIPISYKNWSQLGFFKHGRMADPEYAIKIFLLHFEQTFSNNIPKNMVLLETGSGDSVASALCAYAIGASKIYLIDVAPFATDDMRVYLALANKLKEMGMPTPDISEDMTLDQLLSACNAEYLTNGLNSLKNIPTDSIDFSWSHSTLEHVRKSEFEDTIHEQYRILKPDGIISHNIDLQDHLGGRLNNLRFSEKFWESDLMSNSGFYTNRLRASQIVDAINKTGFTIEKNEQGRWPFIPVPRTKLAEPYNKATEDDLLIRTLSLQVRKPLGCVYSHKIIQ